MVFIIALAGHLVRPTNPLGRSWPFAFQSDISVALAPQGDKVNTADPGIPNWWARLGPKRGFEPQKFPSVPLVPMAGLEPATHRLTVDCSTK